MKQKILSMLRTLFANKGLSQETLDGIAEALSKTVTDEAQIETAVKGVEPFLSTFQKEADKLRTEAANNKKALDDYKSANPAKDPNKDKDDPKDPPTGQNAEITQLLKAMELQNKAIEGLTNQVKTMQQEKTVQTLGEKFKSLVDGEKIPESFYKSALAGGRTFKDEAEMTAVFDELKSNYSVFVQQKTNEDFTKTPDIVSNGFKTKQEADDKTKVSPAMQALIDKKNAASKQAEPAAK